MGEAWLDDGPAGAGTMLAGRYRLTDLLGRGGMAAVYSAEDVLLHRVVAVKVYAADAVAGVARQRVDREMRALARLDHPGLVTIFDAGALAAPGGAECPYLVLELIGGPTLAQRLCEGALPSARVAAIGGDLAETLAYVHGQGIVHRDVKPANILLTAEPPSRPERARYAAKLADFGISQLLDSTRLTLHGTAIGTPNYLSPEQAQGGPVEPGSDVYSLALVLLECLTGQPAYPGAGLPAALARLHHPPAIPAWTGPGWGRLLATMTTRDPAGRPSAEQVAATLARLDHSLPPTVDRPPAVDQPAGPTEQLPDRDAAVPGGTRPVTAPLDQRPPAPAGSRRRSAPWPRRRSYATAAVLLLAAAAAVIIGLIASDQQGGHRTPSPAPTYPAVSGPVGTHLRQLESAVG